MLHRVTLARVIALAAVFVLGGCVRGDMGKSSDTAASPAPAQMVYPTGVLTTAEALPETRGIYAIPVGGGETCCWVDRDVHFVVPVPQGATTLRLGVAFPFKGQNQTITELNDAGKPVALRTVSAGSPKVVTFPLPPSRTYGLVLRVHLRMSKSVVPRDVGAGPDVRRLALVITDAYAR